MWAFSLRNGKEIVRDPLSVVFGVGFPVVLIGLFSWMQRSIAGMPADTFGIEHFTPGMAVFGLSFLSLFLGMLLANDRQSAFLTRLFASPLRGMDYIGGYTLALLPVALLQSTICFLFAALFGFPLRISLLWMYAALAPAALLFIAFGLLLGGLLSSNQVGGIASILVNAAALLSGTWFSLDGIGGAFADICRCLPFSHAVDAVQLAASGEIGAMLPHILWVLGYATVGYVIAIAILKKRMRQS